MSTEWPLVRLGDLITLRGGLSYKGDEIADHGNSMVTMGCITSNAPFKLSGLRRYKGAFGPQHLLQPGDLVIATRDVTQNRELIGCPAVVPPGLPGDVTIAATNLYKVTNNSDIENNFLYWVMKSPEYRRQVIASAKGTTVVMLTKDAVENFTFALPPALERRAVSEFLTGIDDRITLLRETNATLEVIARALFKSWFVDFDPVRAKMAGHAPEGMDEATAALFPDALEETELGLVPKGWGFSAISSVCNISSGKRPLDRTDQQDGASPVPLYGGAGIMGYTSQNLFDSPRILTGRVGTLGKVHIANPPFWASDNVLVITPVAPESFAFCYHWLCAIDVLALNRGSTQPLLTQKDLGAQMGVVPPPHMLAAFENVASPLYDKVRANSLQAESLSSVRDTLLPRLISGQLRLPDAQATLEDALA